VKRAGLDKRAALTVTVLYVHVRLDWLVLLLLLFLLFFSLLY
jgi:hypothetical protein